MPNTTSNGKANGQMARPETHDKSEEDPTMWAVNKMNDAKHASWGHITRNVPVFVPHIVKSKDSGQHIYTVDERRLHSIAEKIRSNQAMGKFVKLYDRHSYPTRHMSQTEQPRIMGLAANPQVGYYGPHKELALKLDFFFPTETWDLAKDLPERSAEFKPGSDGMPAVALLKTEPRLNMGQVIYSETPGHDDGLYIYQGVAMQHGIELEVDDDLSPPGVSSAPESLGSQQPSQFNIPGTLAPKPQPSVATQTLPKAAVQPKQNFPTSYYDHGACGEEELCPESKGAADAFLSKYGKDAAVAKYMQAAYASMFPPTEPTNSPMPGAMPGAPGGMPGAPGGMPGAPGGMPGAPGGMPGAPGGMPGDPAAMMPPAPGGPAAGQPGMPADGSMQPGGGGLPQPDPGMPAEGPPGMPGGASGMPMQPGMQPPPMDPMAGAGQPPGAQIPPMDPNQQMMPMQSFGSGTSNMPSPTVPMQEVLMSQQAQTVNYAEEIATLKRENESLREGQMEANKRFQYAEAQRLVGELQAAGKDIKDPDGVTRYMATLPTDQQARKAREIMQCWKDIPRAPVDTGGPGLIPLFSESMTEATEGEAQYAEYEADDINATVDYCEEHKLDVNKDKDWEKACRAVVQERMKRGA